MDKDSRKDLKELRIKVKQLQRENSECRKAMKEGLARLQNQLAEYVMEVESVRNDLSGLNESFLKLNGRRW